MDNKILIDAINGNNKSIEKIIVNYQSRIYAFVRSKINNQMDIDEVVQETFISCFINIGKLQNIETFSSWLFRICKNKINNYYRSRNVEIEYDENVNLINETKNEWDNYSELLKIAISTLNNEQRDVLQLRYFSGHSYLEISQICKISSTKVKSRLYEAKKILKSKIPHLYTGIKLDKGLMRSNKEFIMKELELIKMGSTVIRSLSLKHQMDMCIAISNGEIFSGDLLRNISEIKLGKEFLKGCDSRLTITDLSKIITYDKVLDKWLINNLEDQDPEIAENLKRNIFVFEDIVLLPAKSIKTVINEIELEDMIIALSSTEKIVKQYILSFYPNDQKKELAKLFTNCSSLDVDINKAQFSIIERIRELLENKEITLSFNIEENLKEQGLKL